MFGIQINYKDGELVVENHSYSYSYKLDEIDNWHKYDLCQKCNHDTRAYDCTENECMKP